jgi:hypothetical protein
MEITWDTRVTLLQGLTKAMQAHDKTDEQIIELQRHRKTVLKYKIKENGMENSGNKGAEYDSF